MEFAENIDDWRGEPETSDVYGDQGESDWSREESSDERLSPDAREKLGLSGNVRP